MSTSAVLVVVMSVVVAAMALAMHHHEYQSGPRKLRMKARPLTQTGLSSLSPGSVNWLAATAFIAALFICLVLI